VQSRAHKHFYKITLAHNSVPSSLTEIEFYVSSIKEKPRSPIRIINCEQAGMLIRVDKASQALRY